MQITILSKKSQIYIPKQIRKNLNIKVGQQFILLEKGGCIELVPKRSATELKGLLAGANTQKIRDRNDRI